MRADGASSTRSTGDRLWDALAYGALLGSLLGVPVQAIEGPMSVVVHDPAVYVVAVKSAQVVAYTRDSGSGRLTPLATHDVNSPVAVALSPDGKNAYVAALTATNQAQLLVFARAPDGILSQIQTVTGSTNGMSGAGGAAGGPGTIAISPDGTSVYFAYSIRSRVLAFKRDPASGKLVYQKIYDGLQQPFAIVVSPNGKSVYASDSTGNAVVFFDRDTATGLLTWKRKYGSWPPLEQPLSLTIGRDGKAVYVAGRKQRQVGIFLRNTLSGHLTQIYHFPTRGAPAHVAVSEPPNHVYVVMSSSIPAENAAVSFKRKPTEELQLLGRQDDEQTSCLNEPDSVALSPDGRFAYVAATGSNKIAVLRRIANPADRSFGQLTELVQCAP
jgi:6-phosphogluconolactonase (cycloisomerase 2 family)